MGYGSKASVANSLFALNRADRGGGAIDMDNSAAKITNSTFYQNRAGLEALGKGGALSSTSDSTLTLENVTLAENSVALNPQGSALFTDSAVTLQNTLIVNNTGDAQCVSNGGTIADGGGNMRFPEADASCPGKAGDPLLSALGNYGGAAQTLALLPGSAALDAGDDATCAATDQRGIARADYGRCDVGAFESRGFILTIRKGDEQSAKILHPFADPLRVLVTSRYAEPVNGGRVRYTAPKSGASMKPRQRVLTINKGVVALDARANGVVGAYTAKAHARGAREPVWFQLANTK